MDCYTLGRLSVSWSSYLWRIRLYFSSDPDEITSISFQPVKANVDGIRSVHRSRLFQTALFLPSSLPFFTAAYDSSQLRALPYKMLADGSPQFISLPFCPCIPPKSSPTLLFPYWKQNGLENILQTQLWLSAFLSVCPGHPGRGQTSRLFSCDKSAFIYSRSPLPAEALGIWKISLLTMGE